MKTSLSVHSKFYAKTQYLHQFFMNFSVKFINSETVIDPIKFPLSLTSELAIILTILGRVFPMRVRLIVLVALFRYTSTSRIICSAQPHMSAIFRWSERKTKDLIGVGNSCALAVDRRWCDPGYASHCCSLNVHINVSVPFEWSKCNPQILWESIMVMFYINTIEIDVRISNNL